MIIFLLFNWKFVLRDQVKKDLILIKNPLLAFIPKNYSAVKSLAQPQKSTKIQHYFPHFSSIVYQHHCLYSLSCSHDSHLLIPLIQLISRHHTVV